MYCDTRVFLVFHAFSLLVCLELILSHKELLTQYDITSCLHLIIT